MKNTANKKEFNVLPEFKKIWPGIIDEFAKVYKEEEHASPFLSLVDKVMTKCNEKDESEDKLFEYIDCVNFNLTLIEPKNDFVKFLIEDGEDFIEE